MEPSKSLNLPCGRDLVQGWTAASVELSLFRQLILSGLGPERAWGGGPQSQISRRTLAVWGPGGKALSIIHTISLPLVRGKGPVADGFGASRERFCPRSACSPGLPLVPRGRSAVTHTHLSPLPCHHHTKLSLVLHMHSPVLLYTQSQPHTNPGLHGIKNVPRCSSDGRGWELLGSYRDRDRVAEAGCLAPTEA